MPKKGADTNKALHLRMLDHMYASHPSAALTTVEVATRLGCTRRTALRYLTELSATGQLPLRQDKKYRWRLVKGGQVPMSTLALDLREGAALYLAARLLAQQTDERNGHVIAALDKLVRAMPTPLATQLEAIVTATAAAQTSAPDMTAIFSAFVMGWASHRVVEVTYRPPHAPVPFTCRFAPYLLEPSGIGRTVYVIGAILPRGSLRTFKLERVQRAALLDDSFEVPADFDGQTLLDRAWGVMYGEAEQVTVRLRFSKWVRTRVRETVWHPSQRIVDLPDGGCEWEAHIGDVTEISPWVRGWGRDCEVIEPEELRADLIKHVRHLAATYGCAETVGAESGVADSGVISTDERAMLNNLFG